MRKDFYRGKPIKGPVAWVYGHYYEHEPPLIAIGKQTEKPKPFIVRTADADWNLSRMVEHIPIKEGTAGQYTGYDAAKSHRGGRKEDLMIFDGDLLEYTDGNVKMPIHVRWDPSKAGFSPFTSGDFFNKEDCLEIIGNVTDSPDLYKPLDMDRGKDASGGTLY